MANPTTSVPPKQLLNAITSTATLFQLVDILDWDLTALTSARFAGTGYGVFHDSAMTQIEFFTFDPTTIANAGGVTIVTRGNDYNGGTTDGVKTKYSWPAGTIVEVGSMPPAMLALITQAGFTASGSVIGNTRLSLNPVTPTIPIAVGDNDTRVPTIAQTAALVGDNTDIAVGSGNPFVTQTGLQKNAEKYKADSSGSSTAYVVTLSPIPISYTAGMVIYAKLINANTTTTPTLNINSLGAKTIVKYVSTALAIGDIAANMFCTFIYDGTNMVLQNPVASLASVALGLYKNGTTTKTISDTNGSQTIAH